MPEHIMQSLYAILATAGIALGLRTLVADHFSGKLWATRKPFTCTYCMTFWAAIPVVAYLHGVNDIGMFALYVMATHIAAHFAIQRLS